MFKEHPELEVPSLDTIIWRYMDIEKFLDLINKSALYFRRVDLLEDQFEGSLPEKNVGAYFSSQYDARGKLLEYYHNLGIPLTREMLDEMHGKPGRDYPKMPSTLQSFREINFVTCWHINRYESVAMWKIYLSSGKGISFKTSIQNVISSLKTDLDIYIGKVKYIDYETEKLSEHNIMPYFFSKMKSFEYENEVRLLAAYLPTTILPDPIPENMYQPPQKGFQLVQDKGGLLIDSDLQTLLQSVIIGPKKFDELGSECESILESRGLDIPVEKSSLDRNPKF